MEWKTTKTHRQKFPLVGDIRVVERFAWWPTDLEEGVTVWLETYYVMLEYTNGMRGRTAYWWAKHKSKYEITLLNFIDRDHNHRDHLSYTLSNGMDAREVIKNYKASLSSNKEIK